MADVKISALPAVAAAATTDIFAIVQGGVTYKASLTQVIAAIPDATGSTRGLLSAADWTTFNGKLSAAITSLGGLTGASQTLATGTTGTDFAISSVGTTHTFNLPTASATNRGALSSADWTTFNSKQSALTFSTGLTNAAGTVTANLSTGVAGGQSVIGGTAASNSLTLSSTSNATKGKILFGTSAYDEVNNRIGIGTASPIADLDITKTTAANGVVSGFLKNLTASGETAMSLGNDQNEFAQFGTYGSTWATVSLRRLAYFSSNAINGASILLYNNASTANFSILTTSSATERFRIFGNTGNVIIQSGGTFTDAGYRLDVNGTARIQGDLTISTKNIITDTTTGTKIGTGTTQKLGFWNAAPIAQPTTAVAAATLVGGGGTNITDTDTFDGYTLQQVVKALRNAGLLA